MSLEDDLKQELADRKARREVADREEARLSEEKVRLMASATARLREAAEVLRAAELPTAEARLAHKQRPSWQWPEGRARVHGWILNCGDLPVMLRTDGWLGAAHRCSDPRKTLCACTFTRADGPLPRQSLGVASATPAGSSEEARLELTIRTLKDGVQTDLGFNAWLTEQVADLLDAQPVN